VTDLDHYARRAAAVVGALALAVGALALNHALIGVFYDDGLYAGIAVALAHGQGFVHPHLPGTPAVIHYPPLYPLLLAPLFGTLSVDAAGFAAKVLNLCLAAFGAALITWHAVRTRLLGDDAPRWLAPVCVGAAALAIPMLIVQSVLFAEPLFNVLFTGAVVLVDSPPPRWRPGTAALLAGSAAALALLTRTIGVAAGAGIVLYLLLVRRAPMRQAALAALPVLLAAGGWALWTAAHRAGIDVGMAINYGGLSEVVRQTGLGAFGRRAPDLVRPLADITLAWLRGIVPGAPDLLFYLFAVPSLLVGCYGFWLLLRRSAIGFTLAGYLAILAIWPFLPDRFLWAVLPWIALAWAAGANDILGRRRALRVPLAALGGALVVGYLGLEARGFATQAWGTQQHAVSSNFAELLPAASALPPDAVLATDDEALMWLYTRRTSVPLYVYGYRGGQVVVPTPALHRAYLERMGVTHILLTGFGGGTDRELDALLGAYPTWLTMIQGFRGSRALFRVNRDR
jgi:hypothetical protein